MGAHFKGDIRRCLCAFIKKTHMNATQTRFVFFYHAGHLIFINPSFWRTKVRWKVRNVSSAVVFGNHNRTLSNIEHLSQMCDDRLKNFTITSTPQAPSSGTALLSEAFEKTKLAQRRALLFPAKGSSGLKIMTGLTLKEPLLSRRPLMLCIGPFSFMSVGLSSVSLMIGFKSVC